MNSMNNILQGGFQLQELIKIYKKNRKEKTKLNIYIKKQGINKLEIQSMKSTTKYQLLFNIMKAMMN